MSEEKYYKIKTRDGTHINEKRNDDGSFAALQFDSKNSLKGPVNLIEVENTNSNSNIKQAIIEKSVIPAAESMSSVVGAAIGDAVGNIAGKLIDKAFDATEYFVVNVAFPAAKDATVKGAKKVKNYVANKKAQKGVVEKSSLVNNKPKIKTSVHSPEEVEQMINNMNLAALYIASCLRELSNTIVTKDITDPKIALNIQNRINELSSAQYLNTINQLLEDKNKDLLDSATQELFKAFQNRQLIVDGEKVPISKYCLEKQP